MVRRPPPALFVCLSAMILGCGALWFGNHPTVIGWFAGDGDPGEPIYSPDTLERITDQLRESTGERWQRALVEAGQTFDRLAAQRAALAEQIGSDADGRAWLASYRTLSRDRYGAPDAPDGVAAEAGPAYRAVLALEGAAVQAYRDIGAYRQRLALQERLPAIDAVEAIQIEAPRRPALAEADILARVRSQSDGSLDAFKRGIKEGQAVVDAVGKNIDQILAQAGRLQDQPQEGWVGDGEMAFDGHRGPTLDPDRLNLDDPGTSDGGFRPAPGRLVDRVGADARHLFVDKWYLMGPFDNRFRSNRTTSFLPETLIDLDSATTGKGGELIGWEYLRSSKPRIEPERVDRDVVYYGWTEVHAERGGKYWLALGSDDTGKLWINGELVWESDPQQKSHRADEWIGEVELRPGVNELLFRCENSGGTMGWSVIFPSAEAPLL